MTDHHDPTVPITTEAQLDAAFERVRARLATEVGEATPAPAPPTPQPSADDPYTAIRQEGAEAITAENTRAETLAGARALIRARAVSEGYPLTVEATDAMGDSEVLEAVGIFENEDPRKKTERERIARENEIAQDPAKLEIELHDRDVKHLEQTWWQLAVSQRQDECRRLSIPYETAAAEMQAEMERKFS